MKKINWGTVISTIGIAALGALAALWQAKQDQQLMEDTVRETIKQIKEEEQSQN